MMFRDINQSSTMARSAYPDGNGELTDFNLFATKYDAGKPSIATDGLPSELSYQVRTAIRRAVDELGINVPEAAVVLKYPIHFYYSDASAELTGVLALPGAVAILALDGFVPKEQLTAPVIGDISRLREDSSRFPFGKPSIRTPYPRVQSWQINAPPPTVRRAGRKVPPWTRKSTTTRSASSSPRSGAVSPTRRARTS